MDRRNKLSCITEQTQEIIPPRHDTKKTDRDIPKKNLKTVEGFFGKWQERREREAQNAAQVAPTPSTVCAKNSLHCHRPLEPIRTRFAPLFALQSHIPRVLQRILQETMQPPLHPKTLRKTKVARPSIITFRY